MTANQKADFLKLVEPHRLSAETLDLYNEISIATDKFSDTELIEGMGDVVDDVINRIKAENPEAVTEEKTEETIEEKPEPKVEPTKKREIKIITPTKVEVKRKEISHSTECRDLVDKFITLVKNVVEEDCNSGSYMYVCSMSNSEQGLEQLTRTVFALVMSEKNMSIQSALSIIESENSDN